MRVNPADAIFPDEQSNVSRRQQRINRLSVKNAKAASLSAQHTIARVRSSAACCVNKLRNKSATNRADGVRL